MFEQILMRIRLKLDAPLFSLICFRKPLLVATLLATVLISSTHITYVVAGNIVADAIVANAVVTDAQALSSLQPYEVIESVTNEIVALIENHREPEANSATEGLDEEARFDQFIAEVDASMVKVIDFNWIAFNVMGSYRKTATEAQRDEFARVFKSGLVETYGRGLLNYGDEEIVLVSPAEDVGEKRRVKVAQEIRNADGRYPLEYTLGLNRDGEWKVINVVINGINLGKTFRNQFVQSAQQNEGDLDKVIAGWDGAQVKDEFG